MSKIAALEHRLLTAGERGLTRKQIAAIVGGERFVDLRMRELAECFYVHEDMGRFQRHARGRRSRPKPWRYIVRGERKPLVEPESDAVLTLLPESVGAAPVSALTGSET